HLLPRFVGRGSASTTKPRLAHCCATEDAMVGHRPPKIDLRRRIVTLDPEFVESGRSPRISRELQRTQETPRTRLSAVTTSASSGSAERATIRNRVRVEPRRLS